MWRLLLLAVPATIGGAALARGSVPLKVAPAVVNAFLALAVAAGAFGAARPTAAAVAAAFAVSAVGDYFMATRGTAVPRFLAGIGAFLVALAGYLLFALLEGSITRAVLLALIVLLAGYLPYFFFALRPAIRAAPLAVASLVYLLAACVALAAAFGLRFSPVPRGLYIGGVALLVFSDTVISVVEFLGRKRAAWLVLPTYFLGQIAVLACLLLLP